MAFFGEPRTTLSAAVTVITAAIKNGRVYTITLSTRRAWGLSAWLTMVHRRLLIRDLIQYTTTVIICGPPFVSTLFLFIILIQDMYVCVFCVFFPSILDIKFVGRTSRGHTGGRSHRIFNPPSFCGACLDFCREKDSAIPFPRRP